MINHEKEIYLIFLLAVDRSWLSIRQASWIRFTIDHSKIQNECKFFIGDGLFSLLVRNPSAASAITMPANGESLLGRSSVVQWQSNYCSSVSDMILRDMGEYIFRKDDNLMKTNTTPQHDVYISRDCDVYISRDCRWIKKTTAASFACKL